MGRELEREGKTNGTKRKSTIQNRPTKKRKIIPGSEKDWGEEVPTQDEEKLLFLYKQCEVPTEGRGRKQTTLKPLVGKEWTEWKQKRELRIEVGGLDGLPY